MPFMSYLIYRQDKPLQSGEGINTSWAPVFTLMGSVEAYDSEEAFKLAKKITPKPVLESDYSKMIFQQERMMPRVRMG